MGQPVPGSMGWLWTSREVPGMKVWMVIKYGDKNERVKSPTIRKSDRTKFYLITLLNIINAATNRHDFLHRDSWIAGRMDEFPGNFKCLNVFKYVLSIRKLIYINFY